MTMPTPAKCVKARRLSFAAICAASVFALLVLPGKAAAETLSIPEFNSKIEQWKAGNKEPPPVVFDVEGRAVPLGPRQLRFRGCDIRFEADYDIPSLTRRNSNVVVTGLVERNAQTGAYTLRIQAAREQPGDVERFLDRRRDLRQQPAARWYDLAAWARARGEFYKDHELLARSDEAYHEAIKRERQELANDRPGALFDLAAKAERLRLPQSMAQELVFEALWRQWQEIGEPDKAALDAFVKTMAARLAGATQPVRTPQSQLEKQYRVAPLEAYHSGDATTRARLERLLYAEALNKALTAELAADGSNGFAVAEKIDKLLPEQHALAESMRDTALAARSKEIETLSRPEVLALAEQYRAREQRTQAEHLLESWLTLRRRRLDSDDTEGLLRLSDEYRALLKRDAAADRLLIGAWRQNPGAPDLTERLRKLGYVLHEGTWITAAEFQARPEGQLQQAIRAGRIDPGMTASHVRRSLGEPQSVARAATSGQVVEVWTYEQVGSTRLLVRLRKNRRQGELTVVDVSQSARP